MKTIRIASFLFESGNEGGGSTLDVTNWSKN